MSALREVKGSYAVVMLVEGTDTLFAARNGNPLVIGLGVNENFLASDVTALLDYTNKVIYLLDGDVAEVSPRGVVIRDPDGNVVERRTDIITWSAEDAQKGGFEHFMLKEIFEEPEAVQNTLTGNLDSIAAGEDWYGRDLSSVRLVACGTSYHAAMIGKYVRGQVQDADGNTFEKEGVVSGVRFNAKGEALLELDTGDMLPLTALTQVANTMEDMKNAA
jgi:glucosamine--fructose-6-phosphate aminotransferase (isomerizing)